MEPDWSMTADFDPANILLVQFGDIGDVVLTTPTIRAVKEVYPDARVSILVLKSFGSLLNADPNLFEVIEATRVRGSLFRLVRETLTFARLLRRKRYTLVIDLRTSDRGAIVSYLTGAPVRIAYRAGVRLWHKFAFTRILRSLIPAGLPVHPGADQSLRVVRELGIDTTDPIPRLFVAPDDRLHAELLLTESGITPGTRIATANPYSRWKYKEWSNAKWGEVIDLLWESFRVPTLLIGTKEEAAACQEIVTGREDRAFNLAGRTTLGELTAVISMSSLHLGVDSAAPHIAAAVNTPTVTIHGPSDWRAWRIVNEMHKVVSPVMDCLPCNNTGCDNGGISRCLDELEVKAVADAAIELLARTCDNLDVSPTL
jgi:lipopolysaccharide heptosyltransferase III